ncbi:hypothetical protein L249_3088 [Ophiocordyceps polyrhachis-furcata BCC 54312]|uniref:Pathway-specific nitrogen regulator n=1 Tax=Ophiocordyceps polyrhachis-furcata BCC 54312 TaxID=1330021 RepID=A0A367LNX3_9HYPO|nr:hypothetical protein L249_3088 [Ophiocordyceps polyrhachis-furcata BCC 54312]
MDYVTPPQDTPTDQSSSLDDGRGSSSSDDDHSPRSSLGSMSEAEQTKIEQTLSQRGIAQRSRSPRISEPPPSEADDDFIPTLRGTPRPPFRSPSSVQALQRMTSPPPPPTVGTPPLSGRRGVPAAIISRSGSPRKTPPRFRRATPPLVLLHVTLLPLAVWRWAAVLDRARPSQLSPEAVTLRHAWRQLLHRTGDTVSDRGVLLPHPQADYEVLEERLLEALELPLQRRARILECGHYLGPADELLSVDEGEEGEGEGEEEEEEEGREDDDDDEDDDRKDGGDEAKKTHWCRTCRSDIRYDSLGEGKVFRVNVYASNGLMRAGAWAACWKEMERVDVELEPIVDATLHDELARLADEMLLMTPDDKEQEPAELDSSPRLLDTDETTAAYNHDLPTPPSSPAVPRCRRPVHDDESSSSLLSLLLEALRLVFLDRKNVAIALLSVFVLMLAVTPRFYSSRLTVREEPPALFQAVKEPTLVHGQQHAAMAISSSDSGPEGPTPSRQGVMTSVHVRDPCALCSLSTSTLRLVETVTTTETRTETISLEDDGLESTERSSLSVETSSPTAVKAAEALAALASGFSSPAALESGSSSSALLRSVNGGRFSVDSHHDL